MDDLKELISARIDQFQKRLAHVEGWLPTEETREAAALPENFLEAYEMDQERPQNHFINTFAQLGMPDPFPEEVYAFHANVPGLDAAAKHYSDLVYEDFKMNREDSSPLCLYIPRKEIMLKLIRACICCKSDWDLWYNREPEEDDTRPLPYFMTGS